MTPFDSPINLPPTQLTVPFAAGGNTLQLPTGWGAIIQLALAANGRSPVASGTPLRISLTRDAAFSANGQVTSQALSTVFLATGLTGDVLSGLSVVEGTRSDLSFSIGDTLSVNLTAGVIATMQDAIGKIESGTTGTNALTIAGHPVTAVTGGVNLGSDGLTLFGINNPTPARLLHPKGTGTVSRIESTSAGSFGIHEWYANGLTQGNYYTTNFLANDAGGTVRNFGGVGCYLSSTTIGAFTAWLRMRVAGNGLLPTYHSQWEGDTGNYSPAGNGNQSLGDTTHRWNAALNNLDISGSITGSVTGAAVYDTSGFVANVKSSTYGAKGDGSTDDTTAIRAAVTALTFTGGRVYCPPGTYKTTGAISLPSNVTLWGSGSASIIQPSLTYAGGGNHGIIEVIGSSGLIVGAAIRDLVIDSRGGSRTSGNAISNQVIMSNCERCLIDNVTFRDHGYGTVGVDVPSDPCLFMAGRDISTDFGDGLGGATLYPAIVTGPCQYNTITRCKFEGGSTAQFGIRLLTDWSYRRSQLAFTNYAQGNVFDNCVFTGSYGWNVIELAGGGTRGNRIISPTFKGTMATLSCVNFDKGAWNNIASNISIEGMAKPTYYLSNNDTRVAAILVNGIPATDVTGAGGAYYSDGNQIDGAAIGPIDTPASVDAYESAFSAVAATRTLFNRITVTSVNLTVGNGNGCVFQECPGTKITNCQIQNVKNGIQSVSEATATSRNGMQINNCSISCTGGPAISFGNTTTSSGDGPFGVSITNNQCTSVQTSTGVICVAVEVTNPNISGNQTKGGNSGILANTAGCNLQGNTIKGASATALRFGANTSSGTVNGNENVDCPANVLFSGTASSSTKIYFGMNSWLSPVLTKSAGYTMTLTDDMIEASGTSAAFAIALPDPRLLPTQTRRVIRIDNTPANAVTFTTPSGSINGNASLTAQWACAVFYSDGANWFKIQ